ncbi:MAG: cell wall hydrolase [Lachnospiraceae bacterium]|nr:cell wall hydrolase [Lachnospiraceae bacterium]
MRNTKRAAAVCTAAAMIVSAPVSALAAPRAFRITMSGENTTAWANLAVANDDTVETGAVIRSAQSTDSEAVGFLYRGGAVTVLYRGEEWSEVQSGNVTGYIRNEYLTFGEEAKGLAEHYGTYGVKASWNDVNMFAGNHPASKIVGTADDGDTYRYIATDGHFIEVQNGKQGTAFVSSEDVSKVLLMDTAVPVSGEDVPVNENVVGEVISTADWSGQPSAGQQTAQAAPAYEEPTYSEPVYNEPTYEEPAYSEPAYSEPAYEEPTYTQPAAESVSGNSELQSLYQAYLDAQAAADAAVANGAGEDEINRTCKAAQDAYAKYVVAQNKADAEKYGYAYTPSTDSSSSAADNSGSQTTDSNAGSTQQPDASYDDSYAEDEAYEDDSYDDSYNEADDEYYEDDSYDDASEESSSADTGSAEVSSSDLELLAALIYCEAGNQPYEGQVAVGAVVMNRIASGSFPGTVHDVIYQGGQFTPAFSGALASALANGSGANYIGAASDAMAGSDPTGGALYFNTSHGSGVKIGAHWFY